MDRFRSFEINCHLLFFSFGGVIIFSICKCVKVVTSGERQLLILHCLYQWELHLLLLVIKESKTKVVFLSCTILGLVVELYFFLIFLWIENNQKTIKEGCTARFF